MEKWDAGFVAVDPDALAAPVGIAGRRQHEEEFLGVDALDRIPYVQLGAGLGNVANTAFALPGPVDRHDAGRIAAIERNPVETPAFGGHAWASIRRRL